MKTFFFYDLETSGLNPREDRIMQFAGQRTDMDLNPIGEPVNLLVKLNDDTLPSPYAIAVTGITPQQTQADGLTEAELCKILSYKVFTPDTIAVGYNNLRFDDEFLRYLFWRSFFDPYEWAWSERRSRWDLLDVVRMTRALRPDGIKWPVVDGKPVNKLELLTKENGISHEAAHDALSDVTALIDVTRLIRDKQPQLYEYLLTMRDKNKVKELVNLDNKREFVYVSGRYDAEFEKATVAFPLTAGRNGNVIVYDLRHDPTELIKMNKRELAEVVFPVWRKTQAASPKATLQRQPAVAGDGLELRLAGAVAPATVPSAEEPAVFRNVIKELQYNRCPAVSPVGVLGESEGWDKIGLTIEQVAENKQKLLAAPDFAERVREVYEGRPEFAKGKDSETQLYDGFLNDRDKVRVEVVRNAKENELADFNPEFIDDRLPELLLHFKARNYPKTLSQDETKQWEQWRSQHIANQTAGFARDLQKLAATADEKQQFVLQELQLWFENIVPADY